MKEALSLSLADAAANTRTGDVWLFRGHSQADRAIRLMTNSPVNHVGVVLALDGLPPLLWHAELGASLEDVWAGRHHRGAQLHRLEDAVAVWTHKYGQQPWMRQIDIPATRAMEDAFLGTINEFDGRAFPRTGALARGWLQGRFHRGATLEVMYCAEVVAITYERMRLLDERRPPNWYDPGRFWSGDHLELMGAALGPEIGVTDIPQPHPRQAPADRNAPAQAGRRQSLLRRLRANGRHNTMT